MDRMKASLLPYSLLLLILLSSVRAQVVTVAGPLDVEYPAKGYGYDGPWNAIEVTIGTPGQKLHFFPATYGPGYLLSSDVCDGWSPEECPARGETFSLEDSRTARHYDRQKLREEAVSLYNDWKWPYDTLYNYTDFADVMSIKGLDLGDDKYYFYFVDKAQKVFPGIGNGERPIPPALGLFCLGWEFSSYGVQLSAKHGDEEKIYNFPSHAYHEEKLPGTHVSIHVGSAALNQPGSLIFGGYDRGRQLSEPISYEDAQVFNNTSVNLHHVKGKFLGGYDDPRDKDETFGEGVKFDPNVRVLLDSGTPYMALPDEVCDDFAKMLPVTLDEQLGLYLWDTEAKDLPRLLSSGYFEFQFSPSEKVIRVPLRLLFLTLDKPLKDKPTPYFPCKRTGSITKVKTPRMTLGRAFLQAVNVGVNNYELVFWISQAPGPVKMEKDIVVVAEQEVHRIFYREDLKWEDSWYGVLVPKDQPLSVKVSSEGVTALDWAPGDGSEDGSEDGADSTSDGDNSIVGGKNKSSDGPIIGGAIGGTFTILLIAAIAYFLHRRSRRRQNIQPELPKPMTPSNEFSTPGTSEPDPAAEMYAPYRMHPVEAESRAYVEMPLNAKPVEIDGREVYVRREKEPLGSVG